jgi:outer membrane lipoprotein
MFVAARLRTSVLAALAFALSACVPAPVLKTAATPTTVTPVDAAALPEHFLGAQVVWGGELLEVHNRADASEMVILAYPLDAGQRPQRAQSSMGRFIAVLPGYVERYDYPTGRFITIAGTLNGARDDLVGEQHYAYAVVKADASHLWQPDFDVRKWHVSIGFGASIR